MRSLFAKQQPLLRHSQFCKTTHNGFYVRDLKKKKMSTEQRRRRERKKKKSVIKFNFSFQQSER